MSILADNLVVPMGQDCPPGYEAGGILTYEDGTQTTIWWLVIVAPLLWLHPNGSALTRTA